MKAIKTLLGGLLVAGVVAGVAAASASAAAPSFLGTFPTTFTSKSGISTLDTTADLKIVCTADTNTGEITGEKTGVVTVDFTGCKEAKVGCRSEKLNAKKEIEKDPAETILVDNQKLVPVLTTVGTKGGVAFTLAEDLKIVCGTAKDTVLGSVIGEIKPVDVKTKTATLTFKGALGKQTVVDVAQCTANCTGVIHLKAKLGATEEEASLEGVDEITFAKELEFMTK